MSLILTGSISLDSTFKSLILIRPTASQAYGAHTYAAHGSYKASGAHTSRAFCTMFTFRICLIQKALSYRFNPAGPHAHWHYVPIWKYLKSPYQLLFILITWVPVLIDWQMAGFGSNCPPKGVKMWPGASVIPAIWWSWTIEITERKL
jgi:hypothetical protein